ncbi:hypothetical protein FPRO05_04922 [Fusarium proliferatum]|uniref:Uncharacterized protein n=1 Tax=Gibberella intermedia TaxID=948311 RepID=A0A365MP30_GIBIN|nr:hypothetical protein FPRO05_04922 [Fusarium proliferatum]
MGNNVVTLQYWRMTNVGDPRQLDVDNTRNRATQTPPTCTEAPDKSLQRSAESYEQRISEGVGSRSIHRKWRNGPVANKANRHQARRARNAFKAKRKVRIAQLQQRILDAEIPLQQAPNKPSEVNKKVQTLADINDFRTMYHARVARLQRKLLDAEPLQTFSRNCEKVMADWNLLKSDTIVQVESSSDPRVVHSFKVLDLALCGRQASGLLRRLAFIRLVELISFLELVISFERDSGRMVRERSYSNASIALDIYMGAQEDNSNPDDLRRQLKERKRVGTMWKSLSEPSPLLVLMYSEAAEAIVEDPERTNVWTLRSAAARILKECPNELLSRLHFAG